MSADNITETLIKGNLIVRGTDQHRPSVREDFDRSIIE